MSTCNSTFCLTLHKINTILIYDVLKCAYIIYVFLARLNYNTILLLRTDTYKLTELISYTRHYNVDPDARGMQFLQTVLRSIWILNHHFFPCEIRMHRDKIITTSAVHHWTRILENI